MIKPPIDEEKITPEQEQSVFNPHDNFFAEAIKNKEVAKDFFKSYIPESFKKDIDFDSIELEKIDAKLLHRLGLPNKVADIIFKVKFKNASAFFILHIEHQSSPDSMLPLRMWAYKIHILTNYLKENPKAESLPPVIGLMYYHGRAKPYPYSTNFLDLFQNLTEEQKEYILNPILIDLSVLDDATLAHHGAVAPFETLMKHSFDQCSQDLLIQLLVTLRQAISVQLKKLGVDYIAINYDHPRKEFIDLVKKYLDEVDTMTIAEQIAKDEAHNAASNMQKEIAKDFLLDGADPERVAKITKLDLETVKKIKKELH